jgi:hypothetical protein
MTTARAVPRNKSVENAFTARGPDAASKRRSTPVDATAPDKRHVGASFHTITTKRDPNDG